MGIYGLEEMGNLWMVRGGGVDGIFMRGGGSGALWVKDLCVVAVYGLRVRNGEIQNY